jgi:hypothetical protein
MLNSFEYLKELSITDSRNAIFINFRLPSLTTLSIEECWFRPLEIKETTPLRKVSLYWNTMDKKIIIIHCSLELLRMVLDKIDCIDGKLVVNIVGATL